MTGTFPSYNPESSQSVRIVLLCEFILYDAITAVLLICTKSGGIESTNPAALRSSSTLSGCVPEVTGALDFVVYRIPVSLTLIVISAGGRDLRPTCGGLDFGDREPAFCA